mmetsp:Transcript_19792/g.19025  ORF Transcript_19792/g.19025 Transcript_19792/m.19025 type:complete len:92 (-) Transcript_19792:1372-1647(-)
MFFQTFLCAVSETIKFIFGLNDLSTLCICFGISFSILHHIFNVFIRKTSTTFNDNILFFSCPFILSRYVQYTISIKIKRNLNLWNTTRGRW